MRFFDLHCDTVMECFANHASLLENSMHIDVMRGRRFDSWAQVFAIWIPDTLRNDDAWNYYLQNYAYFVKQNALHGLSFCKNSASLQQADAHGECASILAVEGGAVLGGQLSRLAQIYAHGVRILTLTWNGENELGFGCQSAGGHLKPFGRSVVSEMDRLGLIADVSHLDRTGFWDVLSMTKRPVIASHSTSAAVLDKTRKDSADKAFSMRRALDDDQIRAIAAQGGLIGLNFCGSFLGDPGDDGIRALLRHADHILRVSGEDTLAVGSDYDGCTMHTDLAGIEKIPQVYEAFLQSGFGRTLCDKIFFENALHFFKNML